MQSQIHKEIFAVTLIFAYKILTSSSTTARTKYELLNIDETFCFVVYRLHVYDYSNVQRRTSKQT